MASDATFGLIVDGHLGGSGVVVSAEGLALTAAHQIRKQSQSLEARSRFFGRVRLEVIAVDRAADLALVRLPARDRIYPYVPISTGPPRLLDPVYLIGSPIYRHNVYHPGRIASRTNRYEYLPQQGHYVHIRYVTGPSPAGTSGGPWLNERGELVGTQVGLMHDRGQPTQIAYISSWENMVSLVKRAQTTETASLFLGVEEIWEQDDEYRARYAPEQEGLTVATVHRDRGVDLAKILVGDLIVSIDEKRLSYREDLLHEIRQKKPGDRVVLRILRPNGKIDSVSVNLGAL